jgi:hypothetical protein
VVASRNGIEEEDGIEEIMKIEMAAIMTMKIGEEMKAYGVKNINRRRRRENRRSVNQSAKTSAAKIIGGENEIIEIENSIIARALRRALAAHCRAIAHCRACALFSAARRTRVARICRSSLPRASRRAISADLQHRAAHRRSIRLRIAPWRISAYRDAARVRLIITLPRGCCLLARVSAATLAAHAWR